MTSFGGKHEKTLDNPLNSVFFTAVTFPDYKPCVVGSIITNAGLSLLSKKDLPADVIEVRADALLKEKLPIGTLEARRNPVLLTLRIPSEGGQGGTTLSPEDRRRTYLEFLNHVEAIDIELATSFEMKTVITRAKELGRTVILSAHSISKAASLSELKKWVARFKDLDGDILKIASLIERPSNLTELADLLAENHSLRLAVMGLGPQAAISRQMFTTLGSSLVYGYLDEAAAPGQPSAIEMRKMVNSLALSSAH